MPNIFIRGMLFLSSYFPLILIISILLLPKQLVLAIILFTVSFIGVVITGLYLLIARRTLAVTQEKLTDFEKRDTDVIGYIVGYLLPFITLPFDDVYHLAALFVFLTVLLIVYINSNLIYINPMLNMLGFHLYEVDLEHSVISHYYIARHRLIRGEMISFVRLSDEIFLERRVRR
jgi:hypothetical protein